MFGTLTDPVGAKPVLVGAFSPAATATGLVALAAAIGLGA
jgi:hypothetical protein